MFAIPSHSKTPLSPVQGAASGQASAQTQGQISGSHAAVGNPALGAAHAGQNSEVAHGSNDLSGGSNGQAAPPQSGLTTQNLALNDEPIQTLTMEYSTDPDEAAPLGIAAATVPPLPVTPPSASPPFAEVFQALAPAPPKQDAPPAAQSMPAEPDIDAPTNIHDQATSSARSTQGLASLKQDPIPQDQRQPAPRRAAPTTGASQPASVTPQTNQPVPPLISQPQPSAAQPPLVLPETSTPKDISPRSNTVHRTANMPSPETFPPARTLQTAASALQSTAPLGISPAPTSTAVTPHQGTMAQVATPNQTPIFSAPDAPEPHQRQSTPTGAMSNAGNPLPSPPITITSPRPINAQALDPLQTDHPFELSQPRPLAEAPQTQITAKPDAIPAQDLSKQIVTHLHANPARQTELHLHPEELGRLRLTVQTSDNTVVLNIQADRADTADLLRRHLPALNQDFMALGFTDIAFSFGQSRHAPQLTSDPDPSTDPPDAAIPAQSPSAPPLQIANNTALDLRL